MDVQVITEKELWIYLGSSENFNFETFAGCQPVDLSNEITLGRKKIVLLSIDKYKVTIITLSLNLYLCS